jgi:hypothetical protein
MDRAQFIPRFAQIEALLDHFSVSQNVRSLSDSRQARSSNETKRIAQELGRDTVFVCDIGVIKLLQKP